MKKSAWRSFENRFPHLAEAKQLLVVGVSGEKKPVSLFVNDASQDAEARLVTFHPDAINDLLARLDTLPETPPLRDQRAGPEEEASELVARQASSPDLLGVTTVLGDALGAHVKDVLQALEERGLDPRSLLASALTDIPVEEIRRARAEYLIYDNAEAFLGKLPELGDSFDEQRPDLTAAKVVAADLQADRSGRRSGSRPIGAYLFTGIGRTGRDALEEATKAIADEFGFVGARFGYHGWANAQSLIDPDHWDMDDLLKSNPRSVLLIENVDTMTSRVHKELAAAKANGFFHDSRGNCVDCSQAIFIETTRAPASELEGPLSADGRRQDYDGVFIDAPSST